jgi:hypothetical protein
VKLLGTIAMATASTIKGIETTNKVLCCKSSLCPSARLRDAFCARYSWRWARGWASMSFISLLHSTALAAWAASPLWAIKRRLDLAGMGQGNSERRGQGRCRLTGTVGATATVIFEFLTMCSRIPLPLNLPTPRSR